jgi:hypothetical protein
VEVRVAESRRSHPLHPVVDLETERSPLAGRVDRRRRQVGARHLGASLGHALRDRADAAREVEHLLSRLRLETRTTRSEIVSVMRS